MRVYRFGPFELNAEILVLRCANEVVPLGPRVVETLLALVECAGETVTKAQLLDRVWPEGYVSESNLAQNVYVLRKTFRERGVANWIQTVQCRGYCFTGPVQFLALRAYEADGQTPLRRPSHSLTRAVSALLIASIALAIVGFTQRPAPARKPAPTGLYEIGRYYWDMRSREGVRASVQYFTRAVDANPSDARAYAGLADANVSMGDYCYGTHLPAVYIARAEQYAQQALQLNPRSAEAHASAGFIALHQERTRDAFAHLRRALSLNQSLASAHEWYAIALLQNGRRQQGEREMRTALRLDPLSVASVAWLSSIAFAAHRYDDAIRYARMALELSPKRMDALAIMGQAYAARGDLSDADRTFARYASVDPYYRAQAQALLARVEAAAHRMRQAKTAFAYALAHADAVEDADLAAAAMAVGDVRVARGVEIGKTGHASWLAIEDAARFVTRYSVLRIKIVSQTSPVWRVTSFS